MASVPATELNENDEKKSLQPSSEENNGLKIPKQCPKVSSSGSISELASMLDKICLSVSLIVIGAISRPELNVLYLPIVFFAGRYGSSCISSPFAVIGFGSLALALWKVTNHCRAMSEAAQTLQDPLPKEKIWCQQSSLIETAEWLNFAVRHFWRRFPNQVAGG
jgi:hypothetical protein